MYQPKGQNQQVYPQNYGMPGNQKPIQNQYVNPGHPQNIQQIPNAGMPGNKRQTFTPGQYQKGQVVFQEPQLIPRQPMQGQPQPQGKKNISISQRPPLIQTISPIPGFPHQQPHTQVKPFPQKPVQQPQPQPHPQPHPQPQPQPHNQINTQNPQQPNNPNYVKTATLMTVNTLSKLPYSKYEQAEYSHQPFYNICGYAFNSYNGKVRGYNEDRTKTIVDYRKPINVNGKTITPRVSYFGVFDGHGGEGCSNFLNNQFDSLLFNSKFFPAYPIQAVKEAFMNAENIFMQKAIDKNRNQLVDKSGSCACVMLIINNILYAINLGDSRALLSTDSGQNLRQITRDHKPNDPIEKARIEKSGAQVYYANKIISNGKEIVLKESNYGPGFKFPYRINPGGISVSFILLII